MMFMNNSNEKTTVHLCPVCQGKGVYTHYVFARGQQTAHFDYQYTKTCHGCGGKGWVVVTAVCGIK